MIKDILEDAEARMGKVEKILISEFASLRAGRATPALLDRIMVDYYGTPTPVNQTANISCPEPRLILIQPWDKNNLGAIEKAILKSDLGITPANDGAVIRLNIPQLTEERRRDMVKPVSYTHLLTRCYVVREEKQLYPTELGSLVVDLMKDYFTDIINVEFTASMEEKLDKIEEGHAESVSYTHLDVYKRQPMGITRTIREILTPVDEVFVCEMGAKQKGDIDAVSYTHLDVYKRQHENLLLIHKRRVGE